MIFPFFPEGTEFFVKAISLSMILAIFGRLVDSGRRTSKRKAGASSREATPSRSGTDGTASEVSDKQGASVDDDDSTDLGTAQAEEVVEACDVASGISQTVGIDLVSVQEVSVGVSGDNGDRPFGSMDARQHLVSTHQPLANAHRERHRLLRDAYSCFFSLAPLGVHAAAFRFADRACFGAPNPVMRSMWFQLMCLKCARTSTPCIVYVPSERPSELPAALTDFFSTVTVAGGADGEQEIAVSFALPVVLSALAGGPVLVRGRRPLPVHVLRRAGLLESVFDDTAGGDGGQSSVGAPKRPPAVNAFVEELAVAAQQGGVDRCPDWSVDLRLEVPFPLPAWVTRSGEDGETYGDVHEAAPAGMCGRDGVRCTPLFPAVHWATHPAVKRVCDTLGMSALCGVLSFSLVPIALLRRVAPHETVQQLQEWLFRANHAYRNWVEWYECPTLTGAFVPVLSEVSLGVPVGEPSVTAALLYGCLSRGHLTVEGGERAVAASQALVDATADFMSGLYGEAPDVTARRMNSMYVVKDIPPPPFSGPGSCV